MRKLIDWIAKIGALIAIALTLTLYLGAMGDAFAGPDAVAIVGFQLYAAIAVLIALVFGFIGRIMDRRVPRPASKLANSTIAIALICGALIFAMPFLFG